MSRKPLRWCLPLFSLLLLSACANVPNVQRSERLPQPLAQQMDVEFRLTQQQIRIDYETSSAAGNAAMQVAIMPGGVAAGSFAGGAAAGLIGSLIDSAITAHRASLAKERERPIHANTSNLAIGELIERSFDALDRQRFAETLAVEKLDRAEWEDASAKRLQPGNSILVLEPSYSVSYDDSFFAYVLRVRVVDRSTDAKGRIKSKPRYSQNLQYILPREYAPGGTAWASLDSGQWQQVLEMASAEVVAMLNHDIAANPSNAQPQRRYANWTVLLEQDRGERAWVRTGQAMLSVPASLLKEKTKK